MARRLPRGQYIVGLLGALRTEVSVNNKFEKTAYDLGHPRNMKAGKQPVYRLTGKTQLIASVFREMGTEEKTTARSCRALLARRRADRYRIQRRKRRHFCGPPPLSVAYLNYDCKRLPQS